MENKIISIVKNTSLTITGLGIICFLALISKTETPITGITMLSWIIYVIAKNIKE